jgi:ADP-ribose pyrophosphatase
MTTGMSGQDVDVLATETVFEGFFRVQRWRLRHRLFAGGWSPPVEREIFERGHAVGVILYDPDRDVLVLIEQFRIGALVAAAAPETGNSISPWLIEIVAGIIDDGETPEQVARREALEEAGCEVGEMLPVCRVVLTPGVCSETIALFCGRVRAPAHGSIHGLAQEHEDIRVICVPAAETFRWLDGGRITNATAMIGLQWFRHNHDRIRNAWRTAGRTA